MDENTQNNPEMGAEESTEEESSDDEEAATEGEEMSDAE